MKAVFADSFYFTALRNRLDHHHAKTVAVAHRLLGPIVTTEWVLIEFANALAHSTIRTRVASFIRELTHDPHVKIVRAEGNLFTRGLELYESRPDKAWSLTDCISFVEMKDEDISEA